MTTFPLFDMKRVGLRRSQILKTFEQKIKKFGATAFRSIPPDSGILNNRVIEPLINYAKTSSETVIKAHANGAAHIVLGRDKPAGTLSGYGGVGAQGASSIDLVVGRGSAARKGKGPEEGWWVDNNFGSDAARIQISALTDIDTNFGLADGYIGNVKASSGIGIKADGVRIVGRSGIKIATGRSFAFGGYGSSGETTSRGGRVSVAPPIELNAGNMSGVREPKWHQKLMGADGPVKNLQGLAMGENTRDSLKELSHILEKLMGSIERMVYTQSALAGAVGVTALEPWRSGAASVTVTEYVTSLISTIAQLRITKNLWVLNYCTPIGFKYITSRNVFST
jgi:hypothetical protein